MFILDGTHTGSRDGIHHLRPKTCHWDRSMLESESPGPSTAPIDAYSPSSLLHQGFFDASMDL